jgi:SAM-dependent methyltransferase
VSPATRAAAGPTSHGPSASLRQRRQQRWQTKAGPGSVWFVAEPPPELIETLERWRAPDGPALDVGCGPGVVTAYLAGRFTLSVGIDVAIGAVHRARERGSGSARPVFALAESPKLPFADGAFAFIFDRGVLHHVPRSRWPAYFKEVARALRADGLYQQLCPDRPLPGPATWRGVRARAGRLARGQARPGRAMVEASRGSMEILEVRDVLFRSGDGRIIPFVHGLFRKLPEWPERPASVRG